MDVIRIRGLELDCIVGTYPHEREREQRVHLDVTLGLDLAPAGRTGRIALTCDYSEIAGQVMAMLRFRRYHLIEGATEELAAMLLGTTPQLDLVGIRLDKPGALHGRARTASVEIERQRAAFPVVSRETDFGGVDTVLETREAGLYRVRLERGCVFESRPSPGAAVLEWPVSGNVTRDGAALCLHEPVVHTELAARYAAADEPAVLFRCICPPGLDA